MTCSVQLLLSSSALLPQNSVLLFFPVPDFMQDSDYYGRDIGK